METATSIFKSRKEVRHSFKERARLIDKRARLKQEQRALKEEMDSFVKKQRTSTDECSKGEKETRPPRGQDALYHGNCGRWRLEYGPCKL